MAQINKRLIEQMLEDNNLSRIEFAEMIGVNRQSLYGWLENKKGISLENLIQLQDTLYEISGEYVSLDDLMSRSDHG